MDNRIPEPRRHKTAVLPPSEGTEQHMRRQGVLADTSRLHYDSHALE